MKNRNTFYCIFTLLLFCMNSIYAAEVSKYDSSDSMKVIEAGKGWQKIEFTEKSIFKEDKLRSKDGTLLPGQDELYIIFDEEGARNAPLPKDEKNELIQEISRSSDGGITILHAGVIDAMKSGRINDYSRYFESSSQAKANCNSWHYRTKSFSGEIGDLSESFDVYNTSNDDYTLDVNLDMSGAVDSEFSADIQYKYKKTKWWLGCFPYKFRIVDFHLQGNMNVDNLFVNLEGTLNTNIIDKSWQITKINAGEVWFWVGPIPVRLGLRIPIDAALKADIEVAGNVGLQSHGTGTVQFDKLCNANFVCVDQTPFVNNWNSVIDETQIVVGLDAQLKARGSLGASLLPFVYSEWFLSAKVGINAGVDAWVWGYIGNSCGNADSTGGNEWVSALTIDADFDLRGIGTWRFLGGNHTIGFLNDHVFYETHIGFFDLLPGGSSALEPMLMGSSNQGATPTYTARMRPCVPFADTVNYSVNWDDGVVENFSAVPSTNHSISHTWFAPGPYEVSLTALSDTHGRVFNKTTTRTIETNIGPNANFTSSCSGMSCTFDASTSSDSDGSIVNYAWSFGGSGINVSNVFDTNGLHAITLTVTDNEGETDSTTRYVVVQAIDMFLSNSPQGYVISWSSSDPSISTVNVYRDGVVVGSNSTGSYLDSSSFPFGTYLYKVCKVDDSTICSIERSTRKVIGPIESEDPGDSDDDEVTDVIIGIP